jgi:hypothetical protein
LDAHGGWVEMNEHAWAYCRQFGSNRSFRVCVVFTSEQVAAVEGAKFRAEPMNIHL